MVEAGSVGDVAKGGEKVYGVTSHLSRNQYSRRMDPFPHACSFFIVWILYKEEKADHHHVSYFVSKHKT